MGILDELKNERAQLEEKLGEEERKAKVLRQAYLTHVLPRMQELYSYLGELADHLNTLNKPIETQYRFPVVDQRFQYRQQNYRLEVDSTDEMTELKLYFDCMTDFEPLLGIEGRASEDKLRDFLYEQGLMFSDHGNYAPDGRRIGVTFVVEPTIPASLEFTVIKDRLQILFDAYNVSGLGRQSTHLRPHQMDAEFFDKLGRLVLRKDEEIWKLTIPEDLRAQLRARAQLSDAATPVAPAPPAEEKKSRGLLDRLSFLKGKND